jgi:signal transduction histidine kinase
MVVIVFSAFNAIDYTEELISSELNKINSETVILANSYTAINAMNDDKQQMLDFLNLNMRTTNAEIIIFDADGQNIYKDNVVKLAASEAKAAGADYVRLINWLFNTANYIPTMQIAEDISQIDDLPFRFGLNPRMPDIRVFRTPEKQTKVIVLRPLLDDADEFIGNMAIIYNQMQSEQMLMKLRANMINTILVSLVFIALLSLFLAAYIGHPLRRLALAAEAIRQGEGSYQDIPNFSDRNDEISVLSETLQAMTAELVERLDSIDSFAADVAHELKNPLTSIRSAVETVTKIKDKKKQEKLYAIILHDLDRMDRLITDISRASRLDTELLRDTLDAVDMDDLLRDVVAYIEQFLDREGGKENHSPIVLANTGASSGAVVRANAARLMQVFDNIISNALSFSPPDQPIGISVNLWQDPQCVEIKIRDHGSGIPEANLERIFERFYTERREQNHFGMHSGLGLSICRQIIRAHGGSITADNHPAGGAVFTVVLPIYEGA